MSKEYPVSTEVLELYDNLVGMERLRGLLIGLPLTHKKLVKLSIEIEKCRREMWTKVHREIPELKNKAARLFPMECVAIEEER